MKIIDTAIADVKIIEPQVFGDERGFFFESFNKRLISEKLGIASDFVQDNHSQSVKGILRGLHFQTRHVQGKLVRAVHGEVFDVAVDLRKNSPAFGKWVGIVLSEKNKRMAWIPPGFAHGFLVLSPEADFLYKTTDYYDPSSEICLCWNDPTVGIQWPIEEMPNLSAKDRAGKLWNEIPYF